MESTETIEAIKGAVDLIVLLLDMSTGLTPIARKIVAYYTLATHSLPKTNTFPLLVLIGPMGTGKSQTTRVVKAFAYRSRALALRAMSPPAFRDELAECHNGTVSLEESDKGWSDSPNYENLLSDRYNRDSARIFIKVPDGGGGWNTVEKVFYGATVLHRRLKFKDAAIEGRSITVNFKPVHGKRYKDFSEIDPAVVDLRKRLQTFTFDPPELVRSFDAAGRILNTFTPILALAEMCGDEEFLAQVDAALATKTEQLKEDQSIEPDGLVVRALVEQLSGPGGDFKFRNVRMKDLKASIFANFGAPLEPRQIAALARELGFQTKESHGFTVVVPTPPSLVVACERVGYEDEEIAKLRKHLQEKSADRVRG